MTRGLFDADGFYSALDSVRQVKRIVWRKVAEESGVSASTLTRMAQGKRPDVDSLAALTDWSGLSADSFIIASNIEQQPTNNDGLSKITTLLRADQNLSSQAVIALEATIKVLYDKLREV